MNAQKVRATAEKYSGGRTDLCPHDIDDPELLLRALVRIYANELSTSEKARKAAEKSVAVLQNRSDALQADYDSLKVDFKTAAKDLVAAEKKVGDFQAKIAFLGSRWETLTGEVNEEISEDAQVAARQLRGQLRAARTELFSASLAVKTAQKELRLAKENLAFEQDQQRTLSAELVETRFKDKELMDEHLHLEHGINTCRKEFEEQRLEKEKLQDQVRKLTKALKDLEDSGKEIKKLKDQGDKRIAAMDSDAQLVSKERLDERAKAQETASMNQVLESANLSMEAKIKKLKAQNAALDEKNVSLQKRLQNLTEDLTRAQQKITFLEDEKSSNVSTIRQMKTECFQKDRSLADASNEVNDARTGLIGTSSRLVAAERLIEEKEAVIAQLKSELADTKVDLEEYKVLAHQRQRRGDSIEQELNSAKESLLNKEMLGLELKRERKKLQAQLVDTETRAQGADDSVAKIMMTLDSALADLRRSQDEVARLSKDLVETNRILQDTQADARAYRSKSQQLEEELMNLTARMQLAETQAYSMKADRDKSKKTLEVEKDNVLGLGKSVDKLAANLQTVDERLRASEKREAELRDEIERLKYKNGNLEYRAESLSTSLAEVEAERDALISQTSQLKLECRGSTKQLKATKQEFKDVTDDMSGLQETYEKLMKQMNEMASKYQASEEESKRLASELKSALLKLKTTEKEAEELQESTKGLNEKLDDYALKTYTTQEKSKELAGELKAKLKDFENLRVESHYSKSSVLRVCDDYKHLEASMRMSESTVETLQGEIHIWESRHHSSEEKVESLKDTNWRIFKDLEASQTRLRDSEAMVKKTTSELRSTKSRLNDAEARVNELTSNVARLLEMVVEKNASKIGDEAGSSDGDSPRATYKRRQSTTKGLKRQSVLKASPR